jgi:predicted phage terminase large subunit-like protein
MTQDILFNEDALRRCVLHPSRAPTQGVDIIIFDTASSTARGADYSAGAAVRITEENDVRHYYVVEIVYGQWDSKELAFQIARFVKKCQPVKTVIERMTHHVLLQREIQRHNPDACITWVPAGNKKGCKQARIKKFATLVDSGRVHFVAGNWLDETFAQCLRIARRDDIADVLGRISEV